VVVLLMCGHGCVALLTQVEALLEEKQQLLQQQEALQAELKSMVATQATLRDELGKQPHPAIFVHCHEKW
jgi:cell division protein FtsL